MSNNHEVLRWLTIEEYTKIYNRAYKGEGNDSAKGTLFQRLLADAIANKRKAAKLPLVHSDVYTSAAKAIAADRKHAADIYCKRVKNNRKFFGVEKKIKAKFAQMKAEDAKEAAKISQPHREARRKCGNPEVKSRNLNACRPAVRRKAEKRVLGTAKSTTAGRVTDYKGERRPCRRKQR